MPEKTAQASPTTNLILGQQLHPYDREHLSVVYVPEHSPSLERILCQAKRSFWKILCRLRSDSVWNTIGASHGPPSHCSVIRIHSKPKYGPWPRDGI
ncbi:MAG: hypothetical protein JWQ49_6441 [Edaphobacter sp.]|nr:hypothetical protein [Edaphobacter sp.]